LAGWGSRLAGLGGLTGLSGLHWFARLAVDGIPGGCLLGTGIIPLVILSEVEDDAGGNQHKGQNADNPRPSIVRSAFNVNVCHGSMGFG
jgi:hypothetical protein